MTRTVEVREVSRYVPPPEMSGLTFLALSIAGTIAGRALQWWLS